MSVTNLADIDFTAVDTDELSDTVREVSTFFTDRSADMAAMAEALHQRRVNADAVKFFEEAAQALLDISQSIDDAADVIDEQAVNSIRGVRV